MVSSTQSRTAAGARGTPSIFRRCVHLGFIALVDAVPLVGIVYFDWSVGRCLIAFWGETLVQGVLMLARMLVHRALTHDSGYEKASPDSVVTINGRPVATGSYVGQFAVVIFVFTLAHGIFLALLLAFFADNVDQHADWGADASGFPLAKGLGLMAFFQAADFVHDLVGIRHRPFEWIQAAAGRLQARLVMLQLGIIFGFFVIVFMHVESLVPILVVVIVLKTLIDLITESRH